MTQFLQPLIQRISWGLLAIYRINEAIMWLLDEQTCSNCQYCKKTTEGMMECTRDYHLISSSFQASNDTCKDFLAFYEKEEN